MGGTQAGGKSAAQTNLKKTTITIDGETKEIEPGTFYHVAGSVGGKQSNPDRPKGFAYLKANGMLDKVKQAGALGGRNSRKGGN